MKRAWDIQTAGNYWLSLGLHIDHSDPSVTLHLPGVILAIGRLKQPGFRWSIRRRRDDRNASVCDWRATEAGEENGPRTRDHHLRLAASDLVLIRGLVEHGTRIWHAANRALLRISTARITPDSIFPQTQPDGGESEDVRALRAFIGDRPAGWRLHKALDRILAKLTAAEARVAELEGQRDRQAEYIERLEVAQAANG